MSEFVDNLKKKISGLFASKAASVTVGRDDVLTRLGVKDHKFLPTPLRHLDVMKYTDRSLLNLISDYKGPCQTHYADPEQEDTSAAISFTTETIFADKRSFALTIHNDSTGLPKREDGMVFGLYGHYKVGNDTLAVDKIIMPEKDNCHHLGKAYEIAISPESLEKAMAFAELCTKDVYERGKINVRTCYDTAERPKANASPAASALKV